MHLTGITIFNNTIPLEVASSSLFLIGGLFIILKSIWDFRRLILKNDAWKVIGAKTIIGIYYALSIGVIFTLSLIYTERNFMADYSQNDWFLFFILRLISLQVIGYLLFVKGFKMINKEYEE